MHVIRGAPGLVLSGLASHYYHQNQTIRDLGWQLLPALKVVLRPGNILSRMAFLTDGLDCQHLRHAPHEEVSQVAQQSTLKSMKALSILLSLAVAGLVTSGIVNIRHDYLLTGTELILWAFVPFALLLGFILPVRCKTLTTNRKACGNWAYGLLFGCRQGAGHWSGKFLFQLGLRRGEVRPVAPNSKGSYTTHQPAPSQSKPMKVTVEESRLAKCGFWVGLVSGIVSIIQAVVSSVH